MASPRTMAAQCCTQPRIRRGGVGAPEAQVVLFQEKGFFPVVPSTMGWEPPQPRYGGGVEPFFGGVVRDQSSGDQSSGELHAELIDSLRAKGRCHFPLLIITAGVRRGPGHEAADEIPSSVELVRVESICKKFWHQFRPVQILLLESFSNPREFEILCIGRLVSKGTENGGYMVTPGLHLRR